ncbi:hypothetical protein SprV_0301083300 [Sparganum proliferum]
MIEVEKGEKEDQQQKEQKAGEQEDGQREEYEEQFCDIDLNCSEVMMAELEVGAVLPKCDASKHAKEALKSVIVKGLTAPPSASTSHPSGLKAQIAQLSATAVKPQLYRPADPSQHTSGRDPSSSRSRPRTANLFWYRVAFDNKALRPVPPFFFKPSQANPIGRRLNAARLSGNFAVRVFYVCNSKSGRDFLVDTGAQISVIPPCQPTDVPLTLVVSSKS